MKQIACGLLQPHSSQEQIPKNMKGVLETSSIFSIKRFNDSSPWESYKGLFDGDMLRGPLRVFKSILERMNFNNNTLNLRVNSKTKKNSPLMT